MKLKGLRRLSSTLTVALGVILVWRGVWVVTDLIDESLFGKQTYLFALTSIAVGVLVLYLHHHHNSGEEHF